MIPIDLSPPADDAKAHPQSSDILTDEGSAGVSDVHPWDPHKAAKDVEVGDFYFKRKNYRAAERPLSRGALYKDNDAIATFRLAVCLEKMDRAGRGAQGIRKLFENPAPRTGGERSAEGD